MITDEQMRTVEGCCRLVLQKIANARIADSTVRSVAENPKSYSGVYIRVAEREGRFADHTLNAAIDELRDELTRIFVPAKPANGSRNDGFKLEVVEQATGKTIKLGPFATVEEAKTAAEEYAANIHGGSHPEEIVP